MINLSYEPFRVENSSLIHADNFFSQKGANLKPQIVHCELIREDIQKKQVEKLKSRKMKDGWMKNDEAVLQRIFKYFQIFVYFLTNIDICIRFIAI